MKFRISQSVNFTLFLSIFFMPFTELRVGKIGPSELFILTTFFLSIIGTLKLRKFNFRSQPISILYALYIIAAFLGLLYNQIVFETPSGTMESAILNIVGYFGVFAFIFSVERSINCGWIDLSVLLYQSVIGVTLTMLFLFIFSMFSPMVGDFTLSGGGGRFMPLVTNVHHTAHVAAVFPFIALSLIDTKKSLSNGNRVTLLLCAAVLTVIAYKTNTGKALFGIIIGWATYFGYKIHTLYIRNLMVSFIAAMIILLALILLLRLDIVSMLLTIFAEEDYRGARASLYSQAYELFQSAPLLGRGPSSHVMLFGKYYDVHNTFLTAGIQAGVLGLLSILLILALALFKSLRSSALLALFLVILLYFFGGDALRRAPLWLAVLTVIYLPKIKRDNDF